jgi:CheY-like chemotaxis protein
MNESILLIDDERIFNFISTKLIEGLGAKAEVLTADGGQEALDKLKSHFDKTQTVPRLILVDFYMSPMDGVGFVHGFNKLNLPGKENTIIGFLSSSVVPSDMEPAKALGITNFLAKPLAETQLRDILVKAGLLP